MIDTMIIEEGLAQKCLKEILDEQENWDLYGETKDGIKTFLRKNQNYFSFFNESKKESSSGQISVKMSADVQAPFFNLLSIFYETDLFPTWIYRNKYANRVCEISKYKFIMQQGYNLPYPFHDRYMVMKGFAVDLIDEKNTILVVAHSCSKNSPYRTHKNITDFKKDVEMELDFAGVLIEQKSSEITHVKLLGSIDLFMKFVPNVLMVLAYKLGAPFIFRRIRKFAENLDDTEYKRRIDENQKVYGDLKDRLKFKS